MATAVIMPKFGFTQETAILVQWLKKEGDHVDSGDPIAEVTTDKVNMEVEAPVSGTIAGLTFKEGDTVPVTEIIAYILKPAESIPSKASPVPESTPVLETAQPSDRRATIKVTPVAQRMARDKGIDLSQIAAGSGPGGRITSDDLSNFVNAVTTSNGKPRATPSARRIAGELGADMGQISGSGPRGRIQGMDVRQWAASLKAIPQDLAPSTPQPVAASTASAFTVGEPTVVPLSIVRRTIGERLQRSAQESPHIYFDADIDAGRLEEMRKRANARIPEGQPRISMTALILRTLAWALGRHPMMNARLEGNNILLLPEINLGVAVAVDYGLIVPVIRNVDRKPITQIVQEMDDLFGRARQNHLRPDDVTGGTFTISNLGMFGVDRFTAIINPPQTGILAVGRTRKMFVPDENDQPVVRTIMTITLSADHRVVDGAIAARFLADLRECMEHPEMMAL